MNMAHFSKKDPKLNEVKAVLQRLQGFPEDDLEPTRRIVPAKAAQSPRSAGLIVGGIVFGAALVLFGAAYVFVGMQPADPPVAAKDTEPAPAAVKAALEMARSLMAKGQVRAAREQLLALAWKGSPDAAWDIARSYDPNVLSTLPNPDAAADIKEATRWYRAWYGAAVKDGLVADSVSLERIIASMKHSAKP
jgi:hypothetical protein